MLPLASPNLGLGSWSVWEQRGSDLTWGLSYSHEDTHGDSHHLPCPGCVRTEAFLDPPEAPGSHYQGGKWDVADPLHSQPCLASNTMSSYPKTSVATFFFLSGFSTSLGNWVPVVCSDLP